MALQAQLSDNVVANLQSQIDEVKKSVDADHTKVGDFRESCLDLEKITDGKYVKCRGQINPIDSNVGEAQHSYADVSSMPYYTSISALSTDGICVFGSTWYTIGNNHSQIKTISPVTTTDSILMDVSKNMLLLYDNENLFIVEGSKLLNKISINGTCRCAKFSSNGNIVVLKSSTWQENDTNTQIVYTIPIQYYQCSDHYQVINKTIDRTLTYAHTISSTNSEYYPYGSVALIGGIEYNDHVHIFISTTYRKHMNVVYGYERAFIDICGNATALEITELYKNATCEFDVNGIAMFSYRFENYAIILNRRDDRMYIVVNLNNRVTIKSDSYPRALMFFTNVDNSYFPLGIQKQYLYIVSKANYNNRSVPYYLYRYNFITGVYDYYNYNTINMVSSNNTSPKFMPIGNDQYSIVWTMFDDDDPLDNMLIPLYESLGSSNASYDTYTQLKIFAISKNGDIKDVGCISRRYRISAGNSLTIINDKCGIIFTHRSPDSPYYFAVSVNLTNKVLPTSDRLYLRIG